QRENNKENQETDHNTSASDYKNKQGNLERSLERFKQFYQPSDDLSMRHTYEASHHHTGGVPYKWYPEFGSNELPDSGLRTLNYDIAGERDVKYERVTSVWNWAANEVFSVVGNLSYFNVRQHLLEDRDLGSQIGRAHV